MVEWGWVGVGSVGAGDHLEGLDSAQGQACAVGARGWGRSGAGRGEMTCTNPPVLGPRRWTQWIFLQLFNKGLAYQAEVPVNWCPALGTGAAADLNPSHPDLSWGRALGWHTLLRPCLPVLPPKIQSMRACWLGPRTRLIARCPPHLQCWPMRR